jgi:hypothetical protein
VGVSKLADVGLFLTEKASQEIGLDPQYSEMRIGLCAAFAGQKESEANGNA